MPNYTTIQPNPLALKTFAYGLHGSNPVGLAVDADGNLMLSSSSVPLTAFDDERVAQLIAVVGWTFNDNVNPDLVRATTTSAGSVTTSNSKAVLQTGAATSSSATISTVRALRYTPGLGALVRLTALFTTGVAGSSQLIGIGDSADGFFFGYQGATFGIIRRQNSTDNLTPQSSWNGDKLDGTGSSGVVLDPTKGNVYAIEFQWLGFGTIDFFIETPTGTFVLVHRIQYPNSDTNPRIFNPTLPLMAQVANTTNATNMTLQTSSGMGLVEGDPDAALITRNSANSSKTGISAENSIVTIRNNTTFQGKTNRVRIILDFSSVSVDGTQPAQVRLVKNATLGGTPAFTDVNPNASVVAFDTAGTTVTGGTSILSYQLQRTDSSQLFLSSLSITLNPGETLTVAVSSTSNTSVAASLSWEEFF